MQGKQLGIILVILGIVALCYGIIGYNHRETVLDVGGIKATAQEHEKSPVATVVGIVALVAGAGILVSSSKRGG